MVFIERVVVIVVAGFRHGARVCAVGLPTGGFPFAEAPSAKAAVAGTQGQQEHGLVSMCVDGWRQRDMRTRERCSSTPRPQPTRPLASALCSAQGTLRFKHVVVGVHGVQVDRSNTTSKRQQLHQPQ